MKNSNSIHRSAGIQQGFTLVELLVVVLIIVVLATLAFLGTSKFRNMADKATSVRNISQLQIANVSYAADHNGKCVPYKTNDGGGQTKAKSQWFFNLKFLANLTGKPMEDLEKEVEDSKSTDELGPIPVGMLDPKVARAKKDKWGWIYASYGMNDTGILGSLADAEYGHNLNQVADPSRTMAFATATDQRVNYANRYKWNFNNPIDRKTGGGEIAYRHANKALVVYFDGHVGEVSKGDLQKIDQAGGITNPFWKAKP